jgi:hypothetical protein
MATERRNGTLIFAKLRNRIRGHSHKRGGRGGGEAVWGDRHPPSRIGLGQGDAHCRPRRESRKKVTTGDELIDKAVAETFNIIVLCGIRWA